MTGTDAAAAGLDPGRSTDPGAVADWVTRDYPLADLLVAVAAAAGADLPDLVGRSFAAALADRSAAGPAPADAADPTAAGAPDHAAGRPTVGASTGRPTAAPPGAALGRRALVLLRVIDTLEAAGQLDPTPVGPVPVAGPYLPDGDRWAGWWAREPVDWPAATAPGRDAVVRALRRLPLGLRVVLVLRDAAGLGAAEAAQVTGTSREQLDVLLESARIGFVEYLDAELTGGTP
jgi:hypothetical protein